jgi:Flp pilus assembly protein TadG
MTARARSDESGATMILAAASVFLLIGVAALAVDLSGIRLDRAIDQRVADAAASAGAISVFTSDGQEGCEVALAYVDANVAGISGLDTDCSSLPASCDPATPIEVTKSNDRFTVTIVYPVTDAHALMTPAALGGVTQTVVAEDGNPCERIGVQISAVRDSSFAQVLGAPQGSTSVHAVALADLPPAENVPVNLLLLDRFTCQVLHVEGNGGVIVDAVHDPDTNQLRGGVAAADSDGSNYGSPCVSDGVIDIDGTSSIIRADGPEGCPSQTGTSTHASGLTKGEGCGAIQTLAPGTPGCNPPACTASGGANPNNPNPAPTALPSRLTRAPVDHRYNCRADYTTVPALAQWATDPLTTANEQDIPGCTGGNANILGLILDVTESGLPPVGSWTSWTGLGHPCDVPSSYGSISHEGNVWIDCPSNAGGLILRTEAHITGDVVADGHVRVSSSDGHLIIDNPGSPGFMFLRNGIFSKDAQSSIALNETFVYASKTSAVAMAGGNTGSLTWTATNTEGHPFDDLALWSDSAIMHEWAGQANLTMSGVFFTPLATVDYAGTAGQNQTNAQFIADKLNARGQGLLLVAPKIGHAVDFDAAVASTLLR